MKTETGVMLMKDGKAWGVVYADGHSTKEGWMPLEDAPLHNPEFCIIPSSLLSLMDTPNSRRYREVHSGKLVKVTRTTVVRILYEGA